MEDDSEDDSDDESGGNPSPRHGGMEDGDDGGGDGDERSVLSGGRKASVVSLGRRASNATMLGRKQSVSSHRKMSLGKRDSAWGNNNADSAAMLRAANLKARHRMSLVVVWPVGSG